MSTKNAEIMQAWLAGEAEADASSPIRLPRPITTSIPFRVTRVEAGDCTVEAATNPDTQANPMGTIHGGVLCTIADAAMGVAHWVGLEEGESFTSTDFRINFFRPVWQDVLTARARVVNRGRTINYYACDIVRGDGKLVAHATSRS